MQLLLPAVLISSCLAISIPRAVSQTKTPLRLFVFGDSYTASGFDINGVQPSIASPLGNPSSNLQDTTTANGPVWPQYLSIKYNTTTTLMYDFAVPGAAIPDNFTYQIQKKFTPKYSSQFLSTAANTDVSHWNANNSIFMVWIGINDVAGCSALYASPSNYTTCLPPRMKTYFSLMETLYSAGARNFFFVNVPPMYRTPWIVGHGSDMVANWQTGVNMYNTDLPKYISKFASAHSDVRTTLYSAFSFFNLIIDNPTKYGFKDNSTYTCIGCTNGTGDMWANHNHPTTAVHKLLATQMTKYLPAVGWPSA